jgi:DNA repair protein RadC
MKRALNWLAKDVRLGGRKLKEDGPHKRTLQHGAIALSDPELLSVLFGDSKEGMTLASTLLDTSGGLKTLCQKDPHELCASMSPKKAAQVLAALELGRRIMSNTDSRPVLRTPEEIYAYLKPRMANLSREVFHVLCFNPRNQLLANVQVASGTTSACPVDPKEVFKPALSAKGCTAIVITHNHPSGDPTPSAADVALTRQLIRGGELLCVRVLDHIVVADGGFQSLALRGQLEKLQTELRGEKWLASEGSSWSR